jgi:MFS family permease
LARRNRRPLPRSLWILGAISLFADLAGEMTYPLLPLFVTGVLGASPVALGLIEGFAEAIVSVMRGLTGYYSDSTGHRVRWVRRGYAITFIGKIFLMAATHWSFVLCGRTLDRIGKGVRGAPRDALIAESVAFQDRGRAFGFHRGVDSLGGVGGALIAAAILAWMIGSRAATPQDAPQFRVIFAIAAISSSIAFFMTWLIPNTPSIQVEQRKKDFAQSTGVPYGKSFWVAMSAMVLFMLGNSSDTFLLLRALDLGESPVKCVLLYALFNATYTAASYPMGLLSDRYGRWPVLATGWAIYALSYAGFAMLDRDTTWIFWGLFGLYGVSVACTEGTARAMIVDYAPKERVASALGLFGFFQGAAVLTASVVAGILWSYGLPSIAFWMGSGFAVAALAILPWVPGRVMPPPVDPVLQGFERLTSDS